MTSPEPPLDYRAIQRRTGRSTAGDGRKPHETDRSLQRVLAVRVLGLRVMVRDLILADGKVLESEFIWLCRENWMQGTSIRALEHDGTHLEADDDHFVLERRKSA